MKTNDDAVDNDAERLARALARFGMSPEAQKRVAAAIAIRDAALRKAEKERKEQAEYYEDLLDVKDAALREAQEEIERRRLLALADHDTIAKYAEDVREADRRIIEISRALGQEKTENERLRAIEMAARETMQQIGATQGLIDALARPQPATSSPRASTTTIERIENFAQGAELAGHHERAQAARDIIGMLNRAGAVFAAPTTPTDALSRIASAQHEPHLRYGDVGSHPGDG